jgi:EKC/KEOPS complex subunit CGI121/TPRKB
MTDVARVKKIYKLNANGGGAGGKKNGQLNGVAEALSVNGTKDAGEREELEVLVLGAMALRGITN